MPLIALKCPWCNANLELEDSSKEFIFCMHCGTKILVKDNVKGNGSPESAKLDNLVSLAFKTVPRGSSSDLQNISAKILELDSDNWVGWYVKGVAAAKDAICYAMYDAWTIALEHMTPEEFRKYKDDFVHYAALASIGYGIDDPRNGVPLEFLSQVSKKAPSGKRFSILIIEEMIRMRDLIKDETALNALINCCQIALAELYIYPNINCFCAYYEYLDMLYGVIASSIEKDEGAVLAYTIFPYNALYYHLDDCDFDDEVISKATDYWLDHDSDEYLSYFNEAEQLMDETIGEGTLTVVGNKRKVKKLIEKMVDVYINRPSRS